MADLTRILGELRREREQLDKAILALEGLAGNNGQSKVVRSPRRRMSAAVRKKIGAAQRARWAKAKGKAEQPAKLAAEPKVRTISNAGRRRIAAAQRARWAKLKAA